MSPQIGSKHLSYVHIDERDLLKSISPRSILDKKGAVQLCAFWLSLCRLHPTVYCRLIILIVIVSGVPVLHRGTILIPAA